MGKYTIDVGFTGFLIFMVEFIRVIWGWNPKNPWLNCALVHRSRSLEWKIKWWYDWYMKTHITRSILHGYFNPNCRLLVSMGISTFTSKDYFFAGYLADWQCYGDTIELQKEKHIWAIFQWPHQPTSPENDGRSFSGWWTIRTYPDLKYLIITIKRYPVITFSMV